MNEYKYEKRIKIIFEPEEIKYLIMRLSENSLIDIDIQILKKLYEKYLPEKYNNDVPSL